MRFLGVDFGEKRIGLATSDESGTLAFPKEIVLNNSDAIQRIGEIIKEENVSHIVIGESSDFSGNANSVNTKIENFANLLQTEFELPVSKQKEFLTSVEARKGIVNKENLNANASHSKIKKESSGRADAGAAALILQRYLDKNNNTK